MSHARPDQYSTEVGRATHTVVRELAWRAGDGKDVLLDACWGLALLAIDPAAAGRRLRAARLTVAAGAAIYVDRFLPGPDWGLLGTEVALGADGRVDAAWQRICDGAVLFDELKTADGRGVPVGPGPTLDQVVRYSAAGRRIHGAAFLGTRVLFLGAPSRSWFIDPAGRQGRLDRVAVDGLQGEATQC